MERYTLFAAGENGYSTYRIPTCLSLPGSRTLVFCEGRRDSQEDYGRIDICMRISDDGGRTFGDIRVIASDGENTLGNPSPVFDSETGTLFLLMNGNLRDGGEKEILRGAAPRQVLVMRSDDLGETWSEPEDITASAKAPGWTWHAVGPCHAVQLQSGRLLIPCNHAVLDEKTGVSGPYIACTLYSDDHGKSWNRGADLDPYTNECTLAELPDGSVYINARSYLGRHRRAVAYSTDGGLRFGPTTLDERLVEPVCQGSALSLDKDGLLFCNPASETRERLTLRRSLDGGRTWPACAVIQQGPSAYCDLCRIPDGRILVIFECGKESAYERIEAAIVRLDELR